MSGLVCSFTRRCTDYMTGCTPFDFLKFTDQLQRSKTEGEWPRENDNSQSQEAQAKYSPRGHLHVVGMLRFLSLIKSSKLAHSLLFCSCVYFCLYGSFNCISFHKLSRQISAFSLSSSGLISASLVLSTIYLSMKVSLIPDITLCG